MTGMLDHAFTQSGYLIPTTTDEHGDQIAGTPVAITGKFRYVTGVERGMNVEALEGIDAIIWLASDSTATEGSILQFDDMYWRVDRLVKARKLSGDTIEFLKAYVKKHTI